MKNLDETRDIALQFEKRGGLIPVIVQDEQTGEVLMLGYVNEIALTETLKTGLATFWSTSRDELWTKGSTSGDFLEVSTILVDCDQDALLFKVNPKGAGACHTKNRKGKARKSCFYRKVNDQKGLSFLAGTE